MIDFTLPELGENVTSGEVLRVLVQPGDQLAIGQAVIELETDKATIEVPSTIGGRVEAVRVVAGDHVTVGQVVLSVAGEVAASPAPAAAPPEARNEPRDLPDTAPAPSPPPPKAKADRVSDAGDAVRTIPGAESHAAKRGVEIGRAHV